MKKFLIVALTGILCAACQSDIWSKGTLSDWWGGSRDANSQPAYTGQTQEKAADINQSATVSMPRTKPLEPYADDMERYRRNIVTKVMGDDYVVYEYIDVRIDEVASLASHYCLETNPGKTAYLRDIYLTKNHKRRATFDCVHLASE